MYVNFLHVSPKRLAYKLCLSHHPRLGPSASQLHVNDDKVSEVVKALTLLQSVMKEPWAQQLIGTISDVDDVTKAELGAPASSKPGVARRPAEATSNAACPEKVSDAKPDSPEPESSTPPTMPVVNSSTHRASHARLARRMASMSEADAPNMAKLWSGNRKDS